jgi:hypothetical protein
MTASNPHPDDKACVVYTTFQPDVRLVVTERERDELAAQGLLAREGRVTDKDPVPAVPGSVETPK